MLPSNRKTIDVWEIQVNYGDGYECEVEEYTRFGAKEQLKTYMDNIGSQYPVKSVKRMKQKSTFTDEELQVISEQIDTDNINRLEAARQRSIKRQEKIKGIVLTQLR